MAQTLVIEAALVPRSTAETNVRDKSALAAKSSCVIPNSTRRILTAFPNAISIPNALPRPDVGRGPVWVSCQPR